MWSRSAAGPATEGSRGEPPDPQDLLGVPKPALDGGFLRTIEHMSELGFLLEHLQYAQGVEHMYRQTLRRQIKDAVAWRFNSAGPFGC